MRIHHLNCISSCPLGGRLMDGRSATPLERGEICYHCLHEFELLSGRPLEVPHPPEGPRSGL